MVGALLVGCPLPFEFTGEGSGIAGKRKLDGSTITAPVTFTYTEASGTTGVIADGGSHTSNADITITLTTNTPNATLYYTTDGSRITELSAAPVTRIDGSATTYEIALTPAIQTLTIHALAIGPHMRPGPITTAEIEVLPMWILTYKPNYPFRADGTLSGGAIPPVGKHPEGTTVPLTDPRSSGEELRYTIGDRMYEFDGWNDRADGTGTTYNYSLTDFASPSTPTIRAANATLYAQWVRLVVIEYYSQQTTPAYYLRPGSNPIVTQVKTEGYRPGSGNYTLPTSIDPYNKPDGTTVDVSNYTLKGWRGDYRLNTVNVTAWPTRSQVPFSNTGIYTPANPTESISSSISVPSTATTVRWYAVWEQKSFTVTYRHSQDAAGNALTQGTLPSVQTTSSTTIFFTLAATTSIATVSESGSIAGWQVTMAGAPFVDTSETVLKQHSLASEAMTSINGIRYVLGGSGWMPRDVIVTPKVVSGP